MTDEDSPSPTSPPGSSPTPPPGSSPGPAPTAGSTLADGLRMAVGTLTAVPVRPPRRIDRSVCAVAMAAGPVAALVPGLCAAAVVRLGYGLRAAPLLGAALAVGAAALTTRALHLDGLADTADGLAASYDRGRALEVMRRGDSGPAGVATLVLVVLAQVAALAQAGVRFGAAAALIGVVAGRAVLPVACARGVPSARPEGLGATVAGAVPRTVAAAVILLTVCGSVLVTGDPWTAVAPPVGVLAAGPVVLRAVRRFGGITGDVLGAAVETAALATWVVLALLRA